MPKPQTPPPARQGPRPLPLHLLSASLTWLTSCAALPIAKSGSLNWNPALRDLAERLTAELAAAPAEPLSQALGAEAVHRLTAMMEGIRRYRDHPYRRPPNRPSVVWREGATELLDYGGEGAPVLFVPSLVNRGYVLDLSARHSLLRYLRGQGLRPWLVEWGDPGAAERGFTLTDYIAGRLERIVQRAVAEAGMPVAMVGYCMGGNLVLAAALRQPQHVARLALLATPWNFHAEQAGQAQLLGAMRPMVGASLAGVDAMPIDALQSFFLALDPMLAARKFAAFAALDPASEAAEDFVALEDWLNDGVPLVARVAEECLTGWYGENSPMLGRWRVAGAAVDPAALTCPALIVLPSSDRIVPPLSAQALAEAIPHARRLNPQAGHIGMVVGTRAESALWQPLSAWLGAPPMQ